MILSVLSLLRIHPDCIGQRIPAIGLGRAETGFKHRLASILPFVVHQVAPGLCKQGRPPARAVPHDLSLLLPPGCKLQQGIADFPVGAVLRFLQDRQCLVPPGGFRVHVADCNFRRHVMDNAEFIHPPPQVQVHLLIPVSRIQKAGFKGFQLFQRILWRIRTDAIEQFIEIQIRQRRIGVLEYPVADFRPPGEVSPQLADIQVMIGGKPLPDPAVPGQMVRGVLHEPPLPDEVSRRMPRFVVIVVIQVHHVDVLLRQGVCRPEETVSNSCPSPGWCLSGSSIRGRNRCRVAAFPVPEIQWHVLKHTFLRGLRCRILQHDGFRRRIPQPDGLVKQAQNHTPVCLVRKPDADPVGPLHAEWPGQPLRRALRENDMAAFQVADFLHFPRIRIPLAHKQRHPLPGLWMTEDRKTGKLCPLVIFPDSVFVQGIHRQALQQHSVPSLHILFSEFMYGYCTIDPLLIQQGVFGCRW